MHYPTDSGLLADAARVLARLARRAQGVIGAAAPAWLFGDWHASAKRLARHIGEAARRRGDAARELRTAVSGRLLRNSRTIWHRAQAIRDRLVAAGEAGSRLVAQFERYLPLIKQCIQQAGRRLAGESVPASDKIVSLFEPHTDIIPRAKVRQPGEFGHKVWLDEVEGGIISGYRILDGNPTEAPQLVESVRRHWERFGHAPALVAADRGCHAPGNEEAVRQLGVRRVAVSVQGPRSAERQRHEQQRWFRAARRFRAGIEGRISVAKRRGWLGRCRDHGKDGFDRWVGWGVVVANLVTIARHHSEDPAA
jgi:IS5 family transposase